MTSILETDPRQLRISIEVSLRYHNRRRAWFEFWHKIVVFIGLLGGSAAFFVIWGQLGAADAHFRNVGMYGALAIAILNALDLVIGFASSASLHQSFYQRFVALAAEIGGFEGDPESKFREWSARKLMIDHDEPAPFHALYIICKNEVLRSMGTAHDREFIRPVRWYRRLAAHLIKQSNFVPS